MPAKVVSRGLRFLAFICFSVGLALPAAPECLDVSGFKIPDPATLNLSNGVHEIAALKTPEGTLSARVRVSGKEISDTRFYFRGKRMTTVAETEVPKAARACSGPPKESLSGSQAAAGKSKCNAYVTNAFCDDERRRCYAQACCRGTEICQWAQADY